MLLVMVVGVVVHFVKVTCRHATAVRRGRHLAVLLLVLIVAFAGRASSRTVDVVS